MNVFSIIKQIYDFDIYDNAHKVPDNLARILILFVLIVPPTVIVFLILNNLPDLDNFTFSFAGFSKSEALLIEGSRQWLLVLASLVLFRFIFLTALAPIDLLVRSKREQKPVAWEDMAVFGLTNLVIGLAAIIFLIQAPILNFLIDIFVFIFGVMDRIKPLIDIPFVLLVIIIYIFDDIFFYLGHRLAHNVRIIWKLGHMQHHRSTNLTTGTQVFDFNLFFLQGGSGSFLTSVIGKAFFIKLLSDVDTSGALFGAIIIAIFGIINHTMSHSYSAYVVFSKYKPLAWLEQVFVTGRIHYVHHSKLPEHNIASGCNFAAQFTVIDRLMGTYAAPSKNIPPTGLFHESRAPGNPLRYALDQWIRIGRELYFNSPKYWHKILFADPSYEPPTPAY